MSLYTKISVSDGHSSFCLIGAQGMTEGDFMRSYLKITKRGGIVFDDYDYEVESPERNLNHYGADVMMVAVIVSSIK